MAAARRGYPLKIDLAGASVPSSRDLPPVAALFQIVFDVKAGYTIAWKRAISGGEILLELHRSAISGLRLIDAVHSRARGSDRVQVITVRSPYSTRRPNVRSHCS